ncbi:hypothetical protein KKC91_07530 [bacterium]|nr:hypothetical protein [bacterium]
MIKMEEETWRVRTFQRQEELSNIHILQGIWKYSRSLVVILITLFITCLLLDKIIYLVFNIDNRIIQWFLKYFSLPDIRSIKTFLGVLAGGISAILGIIFALYSQGFRLSTDRYSETVTKFIEKEPVVELFFQLLIFTDLFIIATLLRIQFTNKIPYVTLAVIICLIFSSLMGILIFKNHYLGSIKPESLFSRLIRETKACIYNASNMKSSFYKSWNLVKKQQKEANELLGVVEALYEDLVRYNNWQDAQFAPISAGFILQYYSQRKRYIDHNSQWFPQKYEKIGSNNLMMYDLKLSYELQGKGPLHITKPNYNWVEDKIIGFLGQISTSLTKNYQKKCAIMLITAYKNILIGDVSKDHLGRFTKHHPGAFQEQEFEIFDKCLNDFISLFNYIDPLDTPVMIEYLNAFFSITSTINEGFEWSKLNKALERLYRISKTDLVSEEMPTLFRETLIDYFERLEVELTVEGQIITPKQWLEHEIQTTLKKQEETIIEEYIKKSSNNVEKIMKICFEKGEKEMLLHFWGIQWTWIQQLKKIGYHSLSEQISQKAAMSSDYLEKINDKSLIEETDIRQQIEYILFPAIVNGDKNIFFNSAKSFLISHKILMPSDIKNENQLLNLQAWVRTPLIIGGMTYIISELKQDEYYIREYVKLLETYLIKPENLIVILKTALYRPLQLIFPETTHFRHWFMQIYSQIEALPKILSNSQSPLGGEWIADHPSSFIQRHSDRMRSFSLEEYSVKEFIGYLEKRNQIQKLLRILKGKNV